MKNHYATQRILKTIFHQLNNHFIINENVKSFKGTPYQEPTPASDITDTDTLANIKKLNDIFSNPKAQIILETNTGFDDDGENCYEVYILKPEHFDHFNTFRNDSNLNETHYIFSIMQYITLFPENVISVWAGPY